MIDGIRGKVDTTFTTERRDMFGSGIVAEIGANAYVVWSAIRYFADFETGKAFPGMRTLGAKTGLSAMSVKRAIDLLEANHLVRIVAPAVSSKSGKGSRGQTYIACDKMTVYLGELVLCHIVIDYIPNHVSKTYAALNQSVLSGKLDAGPMATVQIIPGAGFQWDPEKHRLVNPAVPVSAIPRDINPIKENIDKLLKQLKTGL